MKTLKYLAEFPDVLISLYYDLINYNQEGLGSSIKKLKRYCCYDSRRERLNFEQEMILLIT